MTTKIIRADGVTQLANVKSCVFTERVNADVDLRPGCVSSAMIEVECYGAQSSAPAEGEALTYYQTDGNGNDTLIGIFYAQPSIPTKNTYKFVAYDAISKLDVDFSAWLLANQSLFPVSPYTLVSRACSIAGVTLGTNSWDLSTIAIQAFYADGITCRQIISYAAEISCKFVRCHSDGKIYFDWYTTASNKRIYPSSGVSGAETRYAYKQDGLHYENYDTAVIDRVAVHPVGEDDVAYIYPTGINSGNTLNITNNILLYNATAARMNSVAQNIYTKMTAVGSYRPMKASLFPSENPFRAGDIVSVTDAQGVSFTSIVMGTSISNAVAVLESTGRETYIDDESGTAKKLTQLATDIVQINKLKVDWADINTAIINYLTANNVTAQNLTIVDENGNVLATYDSSGITLGNSGEVHAEIDFNSFQLYDKDGNLYTSIGDARNASGYADVASTQTVTVYQGTFPIKPSADVSSLVVTVNGVVQTSGYTASSTSITFSSPLQAGDVLELAYRTYVPFYQYMLGTLKSGTELGYYSVALGENSESSNNYTVVSGGYSNSATGNSSVVSGGSNNTASAEYSAVSGGYNNTTSALSSTISGGQNNSISNCQDAVICSGSGNTINDGTYSAIVAGIGNKITDDDAFIGSGNYNEATGFHSSVVGGYQNKSTNNSSFVGGGIYDQATGYGASVSGGRSNKATGDYSSISGGRNNTASGYGADASGGYNVASGQYSTAFGENTTANHLHQFVFGTYNIPDPSSAASTSHGNYIEIVGNGEVGDESNARTLDWSGNETLAGNLYLKNASPGVLSNATGRTDGVAPGSDTNSYGFRLRDKNGNNVAIYTDRWMADGRQGAWIAGARNSVYNSLMLLLDSSGNRVVTVSESAPWRKALELCYAANDTFSIVGSIPLTGCINNSGLTDVYLDCVVDKSMENISSVSVTTLSGVLRGVSGHLDSSGATVNYISNSSFTVTATKLSNKHVRIYIKKSSAFSNATAYTPVVYWGTITLKFT